MEGFPFFRARQVSAVRLPGESHDEIQARWDKALAAATRNYNAEKTVERITGKPARPSTKVAVKARAETKENAAPKGDGDTQHMVWEEPIKLADIQTLQTIGKISINDFTSADIQKAQKWAYKFYQQLGTKSPFFRAWFGDWRAYDTKTKTEIIRVRQSRPRDSGFHARRVRPCFRTHERGERRENAALHRKHIIRVNKRDIAINLQWKK